jgi:hypothetical protein
MKLMLLTQTPLQLGKPVQIPLIPAGVAVAVAVDKTAEKVA